MVPSTTKINVSVIFAPGYERSVESTEPKHVIRLTPRVTTRPLEEQRACQQPEQQSYLLFAAPKPNLRA